MEAYQADNLKRSHAQVEVLRKTMEEHKRIEKQFIKSKNNFFGDNEDLNDPKSYENKIVAKRSFFLNPKKNHPKIIKTKNKLYVI
jgi:hypothetical protein